MIQYIHHTNIDRKKWDHCVNESPNGMIYACSWYLDEVCPGWDALVYGDYETVMPLAIRNRMGINYTYSPYYAQQLGVIGKKVDKALVEEFVASIPSKIKLIDVKLNEGNPSPEGDFVVTAKNNYLLLIESSYEELFKGYKRNGRRNLKKAEDSGMQITGTMSAADFARFIKANLEEQVDGLREEAVRKLERVTAKAIERDLGEIVQVQDKYGQLCAAGSFLFQDDRIIFSVCASTPEGRKHHAMNMLVDSQLKKFAGKFRLFDFSGSDMEGVAYFNSTFGAKPVQYYLLHINRLNWLQRILSGKYR